MTGDSDSAERFVSGHSRAFWVIVILLAGVLVDLIAVGADSLEANLISRAINGEFITYAEAVANDERQTFIAFIQLAISLITVALFCIWIHRAHRNLKPLNAKNLKFSSGWAVGWFFVPIMNLFRPYQVMKEIWKASDPGVDAADDTAWQNTPGSSLLGWWWGFWLAANLAGTIAWNLLWRGEELSELLGASIAYMISDFMFIPAALFLIQIIRTIDRRQEEKYSQLSSNRTLSESYSF